MAHHGTGHQTIWRWVARSKRVRVKREEADVAIGFQENKRRGAIKGHWGVKRRSNQQLAAEEQLREELKIKS